MARRSELQGIANSLNGTFISRNNDYKGYWAIGMIKNFALEKNFSSVSFSFPAQKTIASLDLLKNIESRYTTKLADLLMKQGLKSSFIENVSITLFFDGEINHLVKHDSHNTQDNGDPFKSYCHVTDDNGRTYSSTLYGLCRPHSAENEFQSTRAKN